MLRDDLEGCVVGGVGEREAQGVGDICTHIADSFHCTADTNTITKQLYSNKKLNERFKVILIDNRHMSICSSVNYRAMKIRSTTRHLDTLTRMGGKITD